MTMKNVGYWLATSVVAFIFGVGGAMDLSLAQPVRETLDQLGYPAYFGVIIGVWKVLGAIAVLAPRLPRLKEWAYAGMVFDLTGAVASHAAVGDEAIKILTPLILIGAVVASWALRPGDRALVMEKRPDSAAPEEYRARPVQAA